MSTVKIGLISFVIGCISFLLFSTNSYSGDVFQANSLQASSDGINITIKWITQDETNVARFDVERCTSGDGVFTFLATVNPKGPSLYEVVDNNALKRVTTLYQYRVKVTFNDGSSIYSSTVTVTHTISGVRRTWGSIKSMFR